MHEKDVAAEIAARGGDARVIKKQAYSPPVGASDGEIVTALCGRKWCRNGPGGERAAVTFFWNKRLLKSFYLFCSDECEMAFKRAEKLRRYRARLKERNGGGS